MHTIIRRNMYLTHTVFSEAFTFKLKKILSASYNNDIFLNYFRQIMN